MLTTELDKIHDFQKAKVSKFPKVLRSSSTGIWHRTLLINPVSPFNRLLSSLDAFTSLKRTFNALFHKNSKKKATKSRGPSQSLLLRIPKANNRSEILMHKTPVQTMTSLTTRVVIPPTSLLTRLKSDSMAWKRKSPTSLQMCTILRYIQS